MAIDLFTWIDALWSKKTPQGTPPLFMMHRFLASDQDLAIAARYLQQDLRQEPHIMFRTWQGLLPKGRGAPRLSYVVPKKPPTAEELTLKMMRVLGERRSVAEGMQQIVELAGRTRELYLYYGVEPPSATAVAATKPGGCKPNAIRS